MKMRLAVTSGFAAMAIAGGAWAQSSRDIDADGILGFAAAQAPEAGTGVCFSDIEAEAMECAVQRCADESGLDPVYCRPQAACSPADWSADIGIQSEEGPHWHEYLCGWASIEQLEAAIAIKCDQYGLISCGAVQIWDLNGVAILEE